MYLMKNHDKGRDKTEGKINEIYSLQPNILIVEWAKKKKKIRVLDSFSYIERLFFHVLYVLSSGNFVGKDYIYSEYRYSHSKI